MNIREEILAATVSAITKSEHVYVTTDKIVAIVERALAEQRAVGDKVIRAQQTLLAVYRAGGRTPEKALDDLAKYRPQWEQS